MNIPPKDVRETYQQGGRAALDAIPTEDWTPPPEEKQPEPERPQKHFARYPANDLGASELFADRCGDLVRFASGIGWLFWNGSIWERDSTGQAVQLFANVARQSIFEAGEVEDSGGREHAVKRALKLGDRPRIEAALKLAESHPEISIRPEELDRDPMLAACENGVIDLSSGTFHPPNAGDLITRKLGTRYDPAACCPRWEKFLVEVTNGDGELIDFLQRCVGYSLTGSMRDQIFLFLHGTGANGKSVFVETIRTLIGSYSKRASESLFELKGMPKDSRVELAELPGIRALFVSETSQGGRLNERLIKDITGGDELRAEAKYQSGFGFNPQCKIWISGNYAPRVDGIDHGIWRRVRLVPFSVTFGEDRKEPRLLDTLKAELPGILRWAVEGARRWHSDGLIVPERVKAATAAYREDQDALADFVACHLQKSPEGLADKSDVYSRYQEWCSATGINHPLSSKQFARQLKARGFTDGESRGHYWRGVRLIDG